MYPRVSLDVTDYAAADRRGLSVVGEGPCQPDSWTRLLGRAGTEKHPLAARS